MLRTLVHVCAIPYPLWQERSRLHDSGVELGTFTADILGMERRISKGVGLDEMRANHGVCSSRLEGTVPLDLLQVAETPDAFEDVLRNRKLPLCVLGDDYLNALPAIAAAGGPFADNRIGASVFPPSLLESHLKGFEESVRAEDLLGEPEMRRRIGFLRLARQHECGVIEFQQSFVWSEASEDVDAVGDFAIEDYPSVSESPLEEPDLGSIEGAGLSAMLRAQLARAVRLRLAGSAAAVNLSNAPHMAITELLHEFAYWENDGAYPVEVGVVYSDGSQANPIRLGCLSARSDEASEIMRDAPVVRAALMSMRHPEMDREVDFAWFRNQDVSKSRTFAETDTYCYTHSVEQLRQAAQVGRIRLNLYQTGLQPAVIGFYRALIEHLAAHAQESPTILVIPHYFEPQSRDYVAGEPWI